MCRRIYFQRASRFWESTEDISVNAYLNILHYVKMKIDEKTLNIFLGGEIPCYKNGRLKGDRIGPEKNLAYAAGLYYEEYCHDSKEAFFHNIHKNLKMRIALVIVYKAAGDGQSGSAVLPMACCGVNENAHSFIVINPADGMYQEISPDECFDEDGIAKFVIMNVPGMVKMKGIEKQASVVSAFKLYKKRFFFFKNPYYTDVTGMEFFRLCREKGKKLQGLPGFLEHQKQQLRWLHDMHDLLQETGWEDGMTDVNRIIRLYEES